MPMARCRRRCWGMRASRAVRDGWSLLREDSKSALCGCVRDGPRAGKRRGSREGSACVSPCLVGPGPRRQARPGPASPESGSDHRGSEWPCNSLPPMPRAAARYRVCPRLARAPAQGRTSVRGPHHRRAHRAVGDGRERPTATRGCPGCGDHRCGAERRPGLSGRSTSRSRRGGSAAGRPRQAARAEAGGSRVRPPAGHPVGAAWATGSGSALVVDCAAGAGRHVPRPAEPSA